MDRKYEIKLLNMLNKEKGTRDVDGNMKVSFHLLSKYLWSKELEFTLTLLAFPLN